MPELVIDRDRRMIVAGAFRLAFARLGDRWVHSLEHREPGANSDRVLALSFESDPGRDDPARVVSPTYQDIQFQGDGPRVRALLVGQSGPHHFSAVFAVEGKFPGTSGRPDDDPPEEVSIHVDVADRCRGQVEALASTYTVDASSGDLIDAGPTVVAWEVGRHRLTFAADHDGPTRLAWGEAGRRATRVQALAGPASIGATHRLLYLWHWEPDIRP